MPDDTEWEKLRAHAAAGDRVATHVKWLTTDRKRLYEAMMAADAAIQDCWLHFEGCICGMGKAADILHAALTKEIPK